MAGIIGSSEQLLANSAAIQPVDYAGARDVLGLHSRFRALGCRGFSFEFDSEMKNYNRQHGWSFQLRPEINLRMALMAGSSLYYPPRVRAYLGGEFFDYTHYIGCSPLMF